ncbi:MAG: arginine--tRNA ligase [Candidatus Zambryskibacteria bacterium]|nr:arginine--tRNA ligase [Candidatus Zambryskibacteria bacterium]
MTLQNTIKQWIATTLSIDDDVTLEYPGDASHGDFATNIALIYAKQSGKNPRELADEFVTKLNAVLEHFDFFESITVAGPGFINFKLRPKVFSAVVEKINTSGEKFGNHTRLSGQRVVVEYTQPNPFKEFHIGHLMNNIIGESISRLFEAHGTEVIRSTYHGDVGLHVAKAIWGLQSMEVGTLVNAQVLGKAYATGAKLFETNEDVKKEIVALNKLIYDRSDPDVNALYDVGREVSLRYFEDLYKRLGSEFDFHFYESETAPIGKALVEEYLETGVFEKSEGAVIYRGEKFGLHSRVFLTSENLSTYEAKELGCIALKKEKIGEFDMSVTITANEQNAFFTVVEKAAEEVFPDLSARLLHLSHGMMKLPTGKMSSRTGDVITAEAMIETVKDAARMKIKEGVLSHAQREDIAEKVALAALRFAVLRQSIGGDIIFDVNKALSLEGDSGPYLQYASVRASTLIKKADGIIEASSVLPADWETTHIERLLQRYPRIIDRAGREYAPHYLVTYLTELAGAFNSFYASHKIIDASDATSAYRLSITKAFVDVMTSGLHMLGIEIPSEM